MQKQHRLAAGSGLKMSQKEKVAAKEKNPKGQEANAT